MTKTKWTLVHVLLVFIIRLLIIAVLGKIVFPIMGWGYLALQITDSIILILLVAYFMKRRGANPIKLFMNNTASYKELIANGAWVGILLLVLGNWGEAWLKKILLVDITPHPLYQLTQQADRAGQFILPFFVGGFLVPIAEEVFYRGFLFPPLKKRTGIILAIILSALIFTLTHFNQIWFIEIFFVGLVLSWLFYRFQSLLPGVLTHIILNSGRLLMIYFNF